MTRNASTFTLADFGRLRVAHPYIRFLPQWHLLNLLALAGSGTRISRCPYRTR
jgi:hypothetical protein